MWGMCSDVGGSTIQVLYYVVVGSSSMLSGAYRWRSVGMEGWARRPADATGESPRVGG